MPPVDLTTAYQISRNIIVLYRGSVAEVGDVDLVIKQPRHPYSQLLISSIPEPNVDERWDDDKPPPATLDLPPASRRRCLFADRCPSVMDQCQAQVPPLYQVDEHRAAACFLYEQFPVMRADQLGEILATRERQPAPNA